MTMTAVDLSAAIEAELPTAWQEIKGFGLPSGGDPTDRQVLFRAIARGLLKYLQAHETDFLNSITFTSFSTTSLSTGQPVTSVDFDITVSP